MLQGLIMPHVSLPTCFTLDTSACNSLQLSLFSVKTLSSATPSCPLTSMPTQV